MLVLVTLCTNRKKRLAGPLLQTRNLPLGSQEQAFTEWQHRILSCTDRQPARETYCGRGFGEALATARATLQPLWIISAGLGLISADEAIPPYDLTLSPASLNSIQTRILSSFCPARWWRQLNQLHDPVRSLSELVQVHPNATVVITLSSAYAELVTADLANLPLLVRNRVRLVGLVSDQGLPPVLQPLWMAYDSRFDGPDSPNSGTRADFPQRVARHFIEQIAVRDPIAPPEQHRMWVADALMGMRPAAVVLRRQSLDDQAILALIIRRWNSASGSAARMLRVLRDEEGVACEQGRLARLFKHVKHSRKSFIDSVPMPTLALKVGNFN